MVVDASLIVAATSAALTVSFGLATFHYRRANRALRKTLRRYIDIDSEVAEVDARHRVLLDHAPIGCIVWEAGFRIVEWNRQAEQTFGWHRDEMIGRSLLDILRLEEDRDRLARQAAALFAGDKSGRNVLWHTTRDGRDVVCEWRHAAVLDAQGTPVRVVSMCHDITGMREVERENALFRSLVDHTADSAIMLLDGGADLKVLYANAASHRHFGRDDLVGKSPPDWDPAADETKMQQWRTVALAGATTFETVHRRADGTLVPVEVAANPVEHEGHAYILTYVRDLTARRESEAQLRALEVAAALQAHEKRHREVFQHATDALFSIDVSPHGDLVFSSLNPAAEEAFGMPASALLGADLADIAAGTLGAGIGSPLAEQLPNYRTCAESGIAVEFEGPLCLLPTHVRADSAFAVKLIPLVGDDGIERIVGIGRDVTTQRKYENELLKRAMLETRMSRYFDHAPGFFLTLTHQDGRWAMPFASIGIRNTHGIDPADVAQDIAPFLALTHPDDREMTLRLAKESLRDLSPCRVKYRIRHPEKGERWIEYNSQPFREPDGKTVWYGFMHDVTEHRRIEANLADSERRFRSLSENFPDNIARHDLDARMTYVSPSLERTLGRPYDQIVGRKPSEIVMDEGAFQQYDECVVEAGRSGQGAEVEISFKGPGNRTLYHHLRMAPEFDEHGKVVSVLTLGRDITERKYVENALAFVAQRGWTEDTESFMAALARHLGETLGVDYVIIDRLADEPGIAETAALYAKGAILPNMRYDLADTPCANVVGRTICTYPSGIQARFPKDALLVDMQAESYVGIPLWDSKGNPIGLMAILDSKPLDNPGLVSRLLQVVATRAAAELERERAEVEQKQAHRHMALLTFALNHLNDGSVLTSRDGRILDTNRAYSGMLGYSRSELLGRPLFDVVPGLTAENWDAHWQDVVARGRSDMIRTENRAKDGHLIPVEVSISIFEFEGESYNLTAIRDVTDRRRMEEALAARERAFRSLAENIPDTITRYDRQCRRLYVNRAVAQLSGQAADSLIGGLPTDHRVLAPEQVKKLQEAIRRVLAGARPEEIEIELVDCNGVRHDLRTSLVPEIGADGKVTSVLAIGHDITAIREAERRMTRFISNMPGFAFTFRRPAQGNPSFPFASPGIGDLFGLKPEDVRDDMMPLHSKVHAEDQPRVEAIVEAAARDFTSIQMEFRVPQPDGSDRWMECRSTPEREADGTPIWHGIMLDVTERKHIEAELQQREREYRTLAENSPDPIFRYDREGRRTYANRAVLDLARKSADDLLGRTVDEQPIIPPAVARQIRDAIRTVVATRQPTECEVDFFGPTTGRHFVCLNRYVPEFDASGEVVSVLSISRDITNLREAMDALHRSEQDFRTLAENSPDIIVRYDREGRRTYINDAYANANGTPRESLIGKTLEEASVFPPNLVREFSTMLARAVATGNADELSIAWHRTNGEPVAYYVSAVPEFDSAGQVVSVLTVARNITALKETERRLVESRAQLQELTARREEAREEERRRIAQDLHEELGQTLTALRMNISTLPIQYAEALPEIRPRTQSMLGLVDRALNGMRSTVMTLRPTALDAGIVAGLDWLVAEFKSHTRTHCDLDIPAKKIDLDDSRATTVFRIAQEALTNVARHAQASRASLKFHIQDGHWCMEIRDDGRGFDPKTVREHAFGLRSMSERALSLHGELDVTGSDGHGTVVKLRFPQ